MSIFPCLALCVWPGEPARADAEEEWCRVLPGPQVMPKAWGPLFDRHPLQSHAAHSHQQHCNGKTCSGHPPCWHLTRSAVLGGPAERCPLFRGPAHCSCAAHVESRANKPVPLFTCCLFLPPPHRSPVPVPLFIKKHHVRVNNNVITVLRELADEVAKPLSIM